MDFEYPVTRVLHHHGFRRELGRVQRSGGRATNFTFNEINFQVLESYEDGQLNLYFLSVVGSVTSECAYIIIARDIDGFSNAIIGNEKRSPIVKVLQDVQKTSSVSGKIVMNALIHYVMEIKSKYNIRHIQLCDNSYINIHPGGDEKVRPTRIFLADYYTLTRGNTYYSRFGFVPFDPDTPEFDKVGIKLLKENMKIIEQAKLKHCKCLAHHAVGYDPNDRLRDVARAMFRSNPELMKSILGEIYYEMKLQRFVRTSWYLPLEEISFRNCLSKTVENDLESHFGLEA